MNPKKLKKTIKRNTAKRRAQKQTERRSDRISTIRNKTQIAQDIYESLQMLNGRPKRRNGGEYRLKAYDYDMFKYGDPLKVGGKAPSAIRTNKRNQAKSDIKKEQKRKVRWGQNIRMMKEEKKKANRMDRKKRRKEEVKRVKGTTSRKLKKS